MRIRTLLLTTVAGVALTFTAIAAHAQALEQGRLLLATQVLNDARNGRDQGIPDRLLERAYGIAVIPDFTKVAFFLGGARGHGVLVVRKADGHFSNPIFVTLTGGSFGFQWGVQKTDLVLVFTSRKGIEGVEGGKLTLGADVSVAAGPVGRQASAATDQAFNAGVYSYSHSRGIFAGVALSGAALTMDDAANAELYHRPGLLATDIISGAVHTNDYEAARFETAVSQSAGLEPASSSMTSSAAAAGASAPSAMPGKPNGPAAQAFPLQDTSPGSNPNGNPPK
ncbi:MAG TPA: lipid-binding SYLF domain-containing protein [Steroidobacteraceae bacterium]|nr:lipid-binding SYLF domain-containing protein [Steroidobacteraceae bacterium]